MDQSFEDCLLENCAFMQLVRGFQFSLANFKGIKKGFTATTNIPAAKSILSLFAHLLYIILQFCLWTDPVQVFFCSKDNVTSCAQSKSSMHL